MSDIIISILSFVLLVFVIIYLIKEAVRRKKDTERYLEANFDIRGAIGFWCIGAVVIISFTIAYYLRALNNSSSIGYFRLCLIGSAFIVLAFVLGFNKIIIDTKTGNIVANGIVKRKKLNIKDITLIKHTFETWKAYSQNKRMFTVRDRYHDSPIEFYIYIREKSGCEEVYSKDHRR